MQRQCDLLIAVPLKASEHFNSTALKRRTKALWVKYQLGLKEHKKTSRFKLPSTPVVWVVPSRRLTTVPLPFVSFLKGTLNFSADVIIDWKELAYRDAMEQLPKAIQVAELW
jgi:hypothetical protein